MPTANDIIASAQAQMGTLQNTSNSIDAQIDVIKNSGPDGPLPAEQVSQINALRATQKQVLSSIERLALVRLAALDDSNELPELTTSLTAVAKSLQDQASNVASFGTIAKGISASASNISQLVARIKSIAKS